MEQRLILINLLIKLGVAASAASILGRSVEFKSLLFRDERTLKQKIYLVLWIGIPLALGVWIRFSARSFVAGDLSFETTVLLSSLSIFFGLLTLMRLPQPYHAVFENDAFRSAVNDGFWMSLALPPGSDGKDASAVLSQLGAKDVSVVKEDTA